jgi:hypothetical protein
MYVKKYITNILDVNNLNLNNSNRFSTITLLLRSARKLSGYNLQTGIYEKNEFNEQNFKDRTYLSLQYTGLLNYLILLEQIGSAFKPTYADKLRKTNCIYCSLKYYSDLDGKNILYIISLRNSLAHRFSLATEFKNQIKFKLSTERNNCVVKGGIKNSKNKSIEKYIVIYLFDLIDLIESIYRKIYQDSISEKIELNLSGGFQELNSRYTIIY